MKSSVKGLLIICLSAFLSMGGYFSWRGVSLKRIENKYFLQANRWKEIGGKRLVIGGLWSDGRLKLIESSGVYFLTISDKKESSVLRIGDDSRRYSGKEVMKYLSEEGSFFERDCIEKGISYLGDEAMVKKVEVKGKGSFVLELNDSLEESLWWFYEKDQKGKVILFLDKEIIGVFHFRGPIIGNRVKLDNIRELSGFRKWAQGYFGKN